MYCFMVYPVLVKATLFNMNIVVMKTEGALVFHPDYTYSDFVGQILPTVSADDKVRYLFTPGPFTRLLWKAYHNPDIEYFLIIEEINRGNAPAIFGEVFQLLDRTTDDTSFPMGTSEYSITNANVSSNSLRRSRA